MCVRQMFEFFFLEYVQLWLVFDRQMKRTQVQLDPKIEPILNLQSNPMFTI